MTIASAPVEASYATEVTASGATLHAQVDPLGTKRRCISSMASKAVRLTPPAAPTFQRRPASISGTGPAARTQPNAERLTAEYDLLLQGARAQRAGVSEGPQHTFRTQQKLMPLALPDNRAWEILSRPISGGARRSAHV